MSADPNIKRRGKFPKVPELDSEFDNLIKQLNSKITELNLLIEAAAQSGGTPTPGAAQIQSDWNQANNLLLDYIKNKPTIPSGQVNSDWNAISGVAEILNKPSIPAAYTTEEAQDAVGNILDDGGDIDFTYDDATPKISAVVKSSTITEAKMNLADNTTNDVSITKHGFVPKAPNNTSLYLRGDGTWAAVTVSALLLSSLIDAWLMLQIFDFGSSTIIPI